MKPWLGSIRVRLALTITGALALVLILVAMTTVFLVRNTLYGKIDDELQRRAKQLIARLERIPDAALAARRFAENLGDPDHPVNIQILTREGNPVIVNLSDIGLRLPTSVTPEFATLESQQMRVYSTATSLHLISVALPTGDSEGALRILRIDLAIAIPVSLLVVLLLGYRIAKRSLAPVDEISLTARRISSQNLAERIPSPQTDDEIARLVRTLNDMIERLEGSFAAITSFTTSAAHEMRTPLTILRGELELALRRQDITQRDRELVVGNLEEVNRLTTIVEDLFLLARADSHGLSLSYELVSLSSHIERVLPKIQAIAEQKQILISTALTGECTVVGDANRLTQVILNLVDNAVKYSPAKTTIRISVREENNQAVLSISDEGMGIGAEHLDRIFERFYRTDEARNRAEGGTGLGLAIARSIVAAHKGEIRAEANAGPGTTFVITIPLAQVD